MSDTLVLTVEEAPQSDVGLGRARIDDQTAKALGVGYGDIIEIRGKKTTAAKVFKGTKEDEGRGVIRIDGLIRRNLGILQGEKVEVKRPKIRRADRVTLAPVVSSSHKILFGPRIANFVKRGLLERPVVEGDTLIVPGIALLGGALPLRVTDAYPSGVVQISEETFIDLKEGPIRDD